MGIPLYFKIISDKYNVILDNIENKDSLFLDLNCAIHPCCRKILEEYNSTINNEDSLNPKNSVIKLETKMIHETINYIQKLVEIVKPKFLYIAIDGVAPLAKMNQQRLRRHKSVFDRKKQNEIKLKNGVVPNNISWDTNAISPGTEFMEKLCDKILIEIQTNPIYLTINTYFSDINECGEGEHKIINYIKDNNLENNIIIYGLDADLIMLSFVSHKNNIFLLREALEFGKPVMDKFLYLCIDELKYYIIKDIQEKISSKDSSIIFNEKKLLNLIDDYIFICFLIGNDFIPSILSYNIRNDGIQNMLDIYVQLYALYGLNIINVDKNCINFTFLKIFIKELQKKESGLLLQMSEKRKRFKLRRNYESDLEKDLDILNNYPILNKKCEEVIDIGNPNAVWQPNYYKYCLGITDKYDIQEACENYVEGLQWVYNYYFKGVVTWKWQYNYGYAPLLKNISIHLDTIGNITQIKLNIDQPVTPEVQLLYILPKTSSFIIKNQYKKLMNEDSELCDLYVEEYQLETYYKRYLWQCEPKLPHIDINRIIREVKKIK